MATDADGLKHGAVLGRIPLACGSFDNLKHRVNTLIFHLYEGVLPWSPSLFLSVGADRPGVAVPHAPVGVAQRPRRRVPAAAGAHTPTAQTPPCAHTLCGPHHQAALRRLCIQQWPLAHRHPQSRHPASCPRGGAAARSTPRHISARTRTVRTKDGSDGAISVPMAIPMAVLASSGCCSACRCYFLETLGTLLHGKRGSVELIVRVLACLAEGLGIRGTARVFEIDPSPVLQWLVDAAEQLQAFARHVLHDIRVQQVQRDELFALLQRGQGRRGQRAEAIERLERSPQWVWVAMDPESQWLLAIDVAIARWPWPQRVVHQVVQVLAPDCAPLFLTDGFREYMTALLTHYGQWVQPPRRQSQGPMSTPRWMPLPGLLYAQVVKTVRRRRLIAGVRGCHCVAEPLP